MDFVETLKLIGAILAALIASRTIGAGARNWYLKGWGSRKVWRKKLNLLAVGATEEYVENLLGTPVFRNLEGPEIWQGNEEDRPKWVDHIFSTPHAWVVTWRVKDQLESWSVTITDPRFWWDLEDVTFGKAKGKLGRSTFSELVDTPSSPLAHGQLLMPSLRTTATLVPIKRSSSCITKKALESIGPVKKGTSVRASFLALMTRATIQLQKTSHIDLKVS